MAALQLEALECGEGGAPSSYENRVFRAGTGERVKLQKVEALDRRADGPSSYENCVFRADTGERVKLQKVKASPDGRHFEAEIVLLDGGEGANAEGGGRRRTAQPSQRAQGGRRSQAREDNRRSRTSEGGAEEEEEEEEEAQRRRRSEASVGEVETKLGDLLSATEDYLLHVCDCLSAGRAEGLAARLFERCPEANVYGERAQSDSPDTPGDVSVHAGRVVNLYAQFAPGPPMADVHAQPPPDCEEHFRSLPHGRWDTATDRLDWFSQCLAALPGKLPAEGPGGRRVSLAVPVGLGCDEESIEGRWPEYLEALYEFAAANPQLRVVLYAVNPMERR